MANRYANLTPSKNISEDFPNITIGFDRVQADVDNLTARVENISSQSGDDITEIVDARLGADNTPYPTLKDRLDAEKDQTEDQLAGKADKSEVNEIRVELVDLESKANNPLAQIPENSISSSKLRTATDAEKIQPGNLSQAVLQIIAGTTPVESVPGPESVTTETIALGAVTREKLDSLVMSNFYPFQPLATLKASGTNIASILPIRAAIKSIRIFGTDPTKTYAVRSICRNYGTNHLYAIVIHEVNGQTAVKDVCWLNLNNYTEPVSGLDKAVLSETNSSGISGYCIIDWTQIPDNTAWDNMRYNETGLSRDAYDYLLDGAITPPRMDSLLRPNLKYPFQINATLKAGGTNTVSPDQIRTAIKKVELYNADRSKTYAIGQILRKVWSVNNNVYIWNISIDEVSGQTKVKTVCWLNVHTYTEPSGIDECNLVEQSSSGITGKVWIDWSAITNETTYGSMRYNESGLHPLTYLGLNQAPIIETVSVSLPAYIPAVVGHEINIYFDNVINCNNLADYQIDVGCAIGMQQNERWTAVPTAAGDVSLTIWLYKNGSTIVASATTTIRVADTTAGTGLNKRCLFIGDSLTNFGYYIDELANLFASDPMDINFIGTKQTSQGIKHEGRGGWAIKNYLNDDQYKSDTNPFRTNGVYDFPAYITTQGYTGIDHIFIALGTNDITKPEDVPTAMANLATFIAGIRAYSTTVNVHIFLTIPPAGSQDGWGKNNLNGTTRDSFKRGIFEFVRQLIITYGGRQAEHYYLVPVNVNLDTVHNFPTEQVAVNSRNSTQITRQTDNVHPAPSGYYQMSDVIYNWLKNFGV